MKHLSGRKGILITDAVFTYQKKNSRLSKSGSMMNVILDLDSTIISSLTPDVKQPQGLKGYKMENSFIVYERPGLQKFLDQLFSNFKVAVWTAASLPYAVFIIEKIILQKKPGRKLEFFLFDYHGDLSSEVSMCPKDLRLVWKAFPRFTPENTIIIDDFEDVFGAQIFNSYPIPPFEADSPKATKDGELPKLMKKLIRLGTGKNPSANLLTETTVLKAIQKIESD
jgi:TFIIF-interacting CTD phosphatase-like protein